MPTSFHSSRGRGAVRVNCPLTAQPVKLMWQRHRISGIGDSDSASIDVQCSAESTCRHGLAARCPARRLKQALFDA